MLHFDKVYDINNGFYCIKYNLRIANTDQEVYSDCVVGMKRKIKPIYDIRPSSDDTQTEVEENITQEVVTPDTVTEPLPKKIGTIHSPTANHNAENKIDKIIEKIMYATKSPRGEEQQKLVEKFDKYLEHEEQLEQEQEEKQLFTETPTVERKVQLPEKKEETKALELLPYARFNALVVLPPSDHEISYSVAISSVFGETDEKLIHDSDLQISAYYDIVDYKIAKTEPTTEMHTFYLNNQSELEFQMPGPGSYRVMVVWEGLDIHKPTQMEFKFKYLGSVQDVYPPFNDQVIACTNTFSFNEENDTRVKVSIQAPKNIAFKGGRFTVFFVSLYHTPTMYAKIKEQSMNLPLWSKRNQERVKHMLTIAAAIQERSDHGVEQFLSEKKIEDMKWDINDNKVIDYMQETKQKLRNELLEFHEQLRDETISRNRLGMLLRTSRDIGIIKTYLDKFSTRVDQHGNEIEHELSEESRIVQQKAQSAVDHFNLILKMSSDKMSADDIKTKIIDPLERDIRSMKNPYPILEDTLAFVVGYHSEKKLEEKGAKNTVMTTTVTPMVLNDDESTSSDSLVEFQLPVSPLSHKTLSPQTPQSPTLVQEGSPTRIGVKGYDFVVGDGAFDRVPRDKILYMLKMVCKHFIHYFKQYAATIRKDSLVDNCGNEMWVVYGDKSALAPMIAVPTLRYHIGHIVRLQLCKMIHLILRHGLIHGSLWELIARCAENQGPESDFFSAYVTVECYMEERENEEKFIGFICECVNRKILPQVLQNISSEEGVLQDMYNSNAFIKNSYEVAQAKDVLTKFLNPLPIVVFIDENDAHEAPYEMMT
jgi:hypothetical protein